MTGPPKEITNSSEGTRSSFSAQASPVHAHLSIPPPTAHPADLSTESEVDFSPSVGTTTHAHQHPVPTSSNGGATLDWSTSTSDDEKSDRRWSLSIPKRIVKDKSTANHQVVEKQDSLYVGMIRLMLKVCFHIDNNLIQTNLRVSKPKLILTHCVKLPL